MRMRIKYLLNLISAELKKQIRIEKLFHVRFIDTKTLFRVEYKS